MSRETRIRPVIDEYQYYKAFELTNTDIKTYGFSEALEKLLKIAEASNSKGAE